MRVHRIDSPRDLERFVEGYRANGGPVPAANFANYLAHAEVHAIVGQSDRLIGGYLLAPREHARCLQFIPDEPGRTIRESVAAERVCELNLVWLEREHRGTSTATRLWLHIATTLGLRTNLDRIIYATDVAKEGLVRLYRKISVGTLYEGPIHPASGITMRIAVYWSTPARFRRLPLLYAGGLTRRLAGRALRGISRRR